MGPCNQTEIIILNKQKRNSFKFQLAGRLTSWLFTKRGRGNELGTIMKQIQLVRLSQSRSLLIEWTWLSLLTLRARSSSDNRASKQGTRQRFALGCSTKRYKHMKFITLIVHKLTHDNLTAPQNLPSNQMKNHPWTFVNNPGSLDVVESCK